MPETYVEYFGRRMTEAEADTQAAHEAKLHEVMVNERDLKDGTRVYDSHYDCVHHALFNLIAYFDKQDSPLEALMADMLIFGFKDDNALQRRVYKELKQAIAYPDPVRTDVEDDGMLSQQELERFAPLNY